MTKYQLCHGGLYIILDTLYPLIFTLTLDTRIRVSEGDSVPTQSATDTRDRRSAENQKYYATIHKVGLTNSEKIPGK